MIDKTDLFIYCDWLTDKNVDSSMLMVVNDCFVLGELAVAFCDSVDSDNRYNAGYGIGDNGYPDGDGFGCGMGDWDGAGNGDNYCEGSGDHSGSHLFASSGDGDGFSQYGRLNGDGFGVPPDMWW